MSKRGRPPQDMTLIQRCRLKQSAEDDAGHLYEMRTAEEFLKHAKLLGEGVYGQVHAMHNAAGQSAGVAAKIIGCASNLLGDPFCDPFRSEHVEPRMIHFLWQRLVVDPERPVTPHLMAPIGKHKIVPWVVEKHQIEDEDMRASSIYFMEHATNTVLRTYFAPLTQAEFNVHFRVILFQICYTMAVVQEVWPGFKHNDLHDANVCMHTTGVGGYFKYIFHGREFYIPRIGNIAIISDFDFATIPGHGFDNYKTLELEWASPTFAINSWKDQGSDLWCLVASIRDLYKRKFQSWISEELTRFFGTQRDKDKNGYRPMPYETCSSGREILLKSCLFDEYSSGPAEPVWETFSTAHLPTTTVPVPKIDMTSCVRHVPFFYGTGMTMNASQEMYLAWRPADAAVDAEPSTMYVDMEGHRLLALLSVCYTFDDDEYTDFSTNVHDCARNFLTRFRVPIRWWPAVFTCAWMDTVMKMSLHAPNASGMTIENWATWWGEFSSTRYTPMQMLHVLLQWSWWRE